jgi:ferritin-like metal-binding protein YciE
MMGALLARSQDEFQRPYFTNPEGRGCFQKPVRFGTTIAPSLGMNAREEIVDWLRDAYAMERGLETTLQKQADNDSLVPQVRQRARVHLEETRRHAESVKSVLQSLGSDISGIKTGLGLMTEFTKGLGSRFAKDERIKDLLSAYSMEHFEIACYAALAAAARIAGLPQVVEMCERIIPDEERTARALRDNLPAEVRSYLVEHAHVAA